MVSCHRNSLEELPRWTVEVASFTVNPVKFLPEIQNDNAGKVKWTISYTLKMKRLLRELHKRNLLNGKKVKEEIHLELKYSPDLDFYKDTGEYKHFIVVQKS